MLRFGNSVGMSTGKTSWCYFLKKWSALVSLMRRTVSLMRRTIYCNQSDLPSNMSLIICYYSTSTVTHIQSHCLSLLIWLSHSVTQMSHRTMWPCSRDGLVTFPGVSASVLLIRPQRAHSYPSMPSQYTNTGIMDTLWGPFHVGTLPCCMCFNIANCLVSYLPRPALLHWTLHSVWDGPQFNFKTSSRLAPQYLYKA